MSGVFAEGGDGRALIGGQCPKRHAEAGHDVKVNVAYLRFHAEVAREIATALQQVEHGEAADRGEATEREAYRVALARAAELAPEGTAWITREAIIDHIASRYRQDPETLDLPFKLSDAAEDGEKQPSRGCSGV
ncbi:hypothetical protein EV655_11040 [Rhodovulum euryhalinum]|uniref:Uncharacterized protein n=1 Tax=Rhodovulum euryhalinum TaxID=35805 RepID=A0A4R2KU84_9RHOB|nr:hypothetical protein EV655_11040 [Rhodovulum euryhalinum]